MAGYHEERKEWEKLTECCEEALTLLPHVDTNDRNKVLEHLEERLLIQLADAAEGQRDLRRARVFDERARKLWSESGTITPLVELLAADRREAEELLREGTPYEAGLTLAKAPLLYGMLLDQCGIIRTELHGLLPAMAALKVLAKALVQHGDGKDLLMAVRIQSDVNETEAILTAYEEGVLDETRRELAEKRRAAARAPVVAEGEEAAAVKTKSKAAKRKQQKRKALQKKKQEQRGMEEQEEQAEVKEEEGKEESDGNQQSMTRVEVALGGDGYGRQERRGRRKGGRGGGGRVPRVFECDRWGQRREPGGSTSALWASLSRLLLAVLGGAMYDEVHRGNVPLLPGALGLDRGYLGRVCFYQQICNNIKHKKERNQNCIEDA